MRVAIFGDFDGLHLGHIHALREVRTFEGVTEVVAVVTSDEGVTALKGSQPEHSAQQRARMVRNTGLVDEALVGDRVMGEWEILDIIDPSAIAIGYDQARLAAALCGYRKSFTYLSLTAYEPELFHNSLMKKELSPTQVKILQGFSKAAAKAKGNPSIAEVQKAASGKFHYDTVRRHLHELARLKYIREDKKLLKRKFFAK